MQNKKALKRPKPRKIQNKIRETSNIKVPKEASISSEKLADSKEKNWEAEYEALKRKYQFLMAEYSNYQKNQIKTIANIRKYEGQYLIEQLLTKIIDSFDRAMEQNLNEKNIEEFKKGISLIYEHLKVILKTAGVKEHDCKGELFDPTLHSAIDSAPSTEMPPEHILHVIKKAYFFHDKLLRPAEVIVSKKTEDNNPTQGKERD